jgi:hypothetical protein
LSTRAQSSVESIADIAGFWDLEYSDQVYVKQLLSGTAPATPPINIAGDPSAPSADDPPPPPERPPLPANLSSDEEAIRLHSQRLHGLANDLRDVSADDVRCVLEANGQEAPPARIDAALRLRLADLMLHGVPAPCPQCGGRVRYADAQYRCTAWVDAYARCQFGAATMPRLPFVRPAGLRSRRWSTIEYAQVPAHPSLPPAVPCPRDPSPLRGHGSGVATAVAQPPPPMPSPAH